MQEAVRGGWEQRADRDKPRNLGDPHWWVLAQRFDRMHKIRPAFGEVGRAHSSHEAGNGRGAKGRCCGSEPITKGVPLDG